MANDHQTEYQEQDQQPSTQQSQSKIKLVPYVSLDGEWTLSDDFIDAVFLKMVDQGLLKTVFWEGHVTNLNHFLALMKSPNNHPVFFFDNKTCVGFAWLSSVAGNYAFTHFCLFKDVWGKAVEVGLNAVDYWFSWPGTDGPLLDVLIGIMPGFNKRAHKYVDKLGWTKLGQIPGMFKDKDRNRENAVVYYKTRE